MSNRLNKLSRQVNKLEDICYERKYKILKGKRLNCWQILSTSLTM